MHSSKLIKVLRALSPEEFKNLHRYLHKAIVKDRPGIGDSLLLMKAIVRFYPEFLPNKIEKEKIFKKVYPGEIYKKGKLEKQMSNLFALIREFILELQEASNNTQRELLTLASFYRSRSLDNMADICMKKYIQTLDASPEKDLHYYYDLFQLEKRNANHKALRLHTKEAPDFAKALDALDHYYIFEKLELACRMLAINRFIYPIEIGKSLELIELLKPVLDSNHFGVPIIQVYYRAYCLLKAEEKDSEDQFIAFEKIFKKHYKQISEQQLLPLNTIIRNHCITQYHKGIEGYLEKSFQVYKQHLVEGYLYSEGKLFSGTMINIVIMGLRLKHFKWVDSFIQNHKSRIIGTDSPEEFYNLCRANYFFFTKKYDEALDLLIENYEHIYYRLMARRLEIKIYFELKHVLLMPRIDAFKIYLYRLPKKKITSKQDFGNRNFIDILKQIHLPRTLQNPKRIDKLINKINAFEFISEKDWLIEKLESLR